MLGGSGVSADEVSARNKKVLILFSFFFCERIDPLRGHPRAGVNLGWATIICSYLKAVCANSSQQCLGSFRNYANWELFQMTCFSWQVSKITSHLEGCIDPFDWDVFQSHLTNNLHNLIRWVGVSFWNAKPLKFRISCRFVELLNKMCFVGGLIVCTVQCQLKALLYKL